MRASRRGRTVVVAGIASATALVAAVWLAAGTPGISDGGSGPAGPSTAVDHGGHGGHRVAGDGGEPDPEQLALIRDSMARYEDIDAALADGWVQEHPDWPGTGAHFYRESDWAETGPARPDVALDDPEFLMYSRLRTGEWELVAVAYVVDQAVYPEPPPAPQGALYHGHVWNCIVGGEELEEEDHGVISRDECQAMEGEWSPGGVWMAHAWLIDNPDGVFAEENPLLTGSEGGG